MSATQTADEDGGMDLGDQMLAVEQHSLNQDRVRGRVIDLDDTGDTIDVTVRVLTTREETTVTYDKPDVWDRQHRFVRLVKWCGYNSASAAQIVGEEVPLYRDGAEGDWGIETEELVAESVFEHPGYYYGALKGSLTAAAAIGSTAYLAAHLPLLLAVVVGLGVAFVGAYWIYRPTDDLRSQLHTGGIS